MGISLAGLIGAFVGLVVGLLNYGAITAIVERSLRRLDKSATVAERQNFERKIALMRKIVLAIDIVTFPLLGYWFGRTMGG